jgi:hypothetical protein
MLSYAYFFIFLNTLKDIEVSRWKIIVFYAISTRCVIYRDQTPSDPPEDLVVGVLWLVAGSCRTFSEINTEKNKRIIVTRPTIHVKLPRRVWVTEISWSQFRLSIVTWPHHLPGDWTWSFMRRVSPGSTLHCLLFFSALTLLSILFRLISWYLTNS